MPPPTDLTSILRSARKSQRLSQAALGAKVGAPQSYISRVENGGVDLQTSSLVELARALDLELVLVPKDHLAEVAALAPQDPHSSPDGIRDQAVRNLARAARMAGELGRRFPHSKIFQGLIRALDDLKHQPLSNETGGRLNPILEDALPTLRAIQASARGRPKPGYQEVAAVRSLEVLTRQLIAECEALA
ncbi:MAG: helix-turn-helix transcriptional regulator, partial [Alphaproteobacteria bacterium]|nr:helix-turn-helix transcriptional regulator [Alphaproteobacteria bacterium]